MAADARDGDDAVLERLTERLEHGTRELRELVEEEYAVMPECAGMSLDELGRYFASMPSSRRNLRTASCGIVP